MDRELLNIANACCMTMTNEHVSPHQLEPDQLTNLQRSLSLSARSLAHQRLRRQVIAKLLLLSSAHSCRLQLIMSFVALKPQACLHIAGRRLLGKQGARLVLDGGGT